MLIHLIYFSSTYSIGSDYQAIKQGNSNYMKKRNGGRLKNHPAIELTAGNKEGIR